MKTKSTIFKILVLFLLIFISANNNITAQSWVATGAKWNYSVLNYWGPQDVYYKIVKIGDTLIDTHICDILSETEYYNNPNTNIVDSFFQGKEYTYTENNKVYRYLNNQFKVLYDFTLNVGDTFYIYGDTSLMPTCPECSDSAAMKVDSIGFVDINGSSLKRIYSHPLVFNDCWITGPYYTEIIGNSSFLLPNYGLYCNIVDLFCVGPFLCYSDDSGFSYNELDAMHPTCEPTPVVSFPYSNATWSEYHVPPMLTSEHAYYYSNAITTDGEMFFPFYYHKLFYSLTDTIYSNPDTASYSGWIREFNNLVYFLPKDSINEYLIYDFTLNVGDTIKYDYGIFAWNYGFGAIDTLVVALIDTVILEDGLIRKRFSFKDQWGNFNFGKWIEGIGNIMGLLIPICNLPTNGSNNFLVCHKRNGNQVYLDDNFDACFPFYDEIDEPKINRKSVNIFPNPVSYTSTITWNQQNNFTQLEIYNMFGILVQKSSIDNITSFKLENKQFNKGIFVLKLLDKNGSTSSKKFIIL